MTTEVLVVGGGGGGGMDMGGGGGGGGVVYDPSHALIKGSISVTVGNGGTGGPAAGTNGQPSAHQYTIPAQNGQNSVFNTITAYGGGAGGSSVNTFTPGSAGSAGGSGGGASGYNNNGVAVGTVKGGLGTDGQGFRGGNQGNAYYSGGGGGAGGAGIDGNTKADGGPGILNSIMGTAYYWGGGGGGAGYSICGGNGGIGGGGGGAICTTTGGAGLNNGLPGGGGGGGVQANTPGGNAGANTGGGGGGSAHYQGNNKGGDGGSGIVVIRYSTSQLSFSREEVLISKEDADNDGYRLILNADDTVTCSINNIDITTTTTISDADWHHVACTIDRDGDGKLYIDGKLEASVTFGSPITIATTANLTIGTRSYSPTTYFMGQLDELRIYNYALTEEQIRIAMNQGSVSF
jgi:hypothetical protein